MSLARREVLAGLALGGVAGAAAAEPPGWRFDFQTRPAPGYRAVPADALYAPEAGFGFEPRPVGAAPGAFQFSVAVPEGDYRVTVVLGDARAASNTTIKAEARRLMLERVETRPGAFVSRSFVVNVRTDRLAPPPPNAPGGDRVLLNPREHGSPNWDDRLTLEVLGPAPRLARLEIVPVVAPTLFLVGDSTVTDQPTEPAAGWGQMLPRFFGPGVAVANHAESGETLKSFLIERRLDKVLSRIKPGDYLFIQFGHNDSKANWPQTHAPAQTTFRDYLRAYVGEARRFGATPVLVTSMHRRVFDAAGRIVNTHGAYPDAVRAVAAEVGAPLIDLMTMSAGLYEALGPDQAWKAFANGGQDATHHNNYGGYQLARCVVEAVRVSIPGLAALLADDVTPFDPARPPAPDGFVLAESLARDAVTPRGN